MGHALRLLVAQSDPLGGTIEIDQFYFGATPRLDADRPRLGRGRKGQPNTLKTPALTVVQRPEILTTGSPAGKAHAAVIDNLSEAETDRVLSMSVDPNSHLMSDSWQGFVSIGTAFSAHDTVNHSKREYARGPVHTNSAEGYNDRVRRTISGVFHHISPHHANLYFNEISFRWSQRIVTIQARYAVTAKGTKPFEHCGRGYHRHYNYWRYFVPQLESKFAGLAKAAFTSNPL